MIPEVDQDSGAKSLDFLPDRFLAVESVWCDSLTAGALAPTFFTFSAMNWISLFRKKLESFQVNNN